MKKPELLMPAGNLETLKTAVRFGADAVYIGGEAFSLRAKADNFGHDEMQEAIRYAHAHGVRLYVTANIYAHNRDIPEIRRYFAELRELGPDAVIISDPGVFLAAREIMPEIQIHISTQMNSTNYETWRFWRELGAARIVAARELSLEEIREIREHIPEEMEIECFVHGAMCISYSGRCLLSAFMTGRSANEGACTHPCRWNYRLEEETRPGQYYPVEENERGTYIFNSKDLCMIGHVPELMEAGINSFKVEGRMKTELYVATVAKVYRTAIDDYMESPEKYRQRLPYYLEEIEKCTFRDYTSGFYFGKPDAGAQIYDNSTYVRNYIYLGTVLQAGAGETALPAGAPGAALPEGISGAALPAAAAGMALFEQKNKFSVGDEIEILSPSSDTQTVKVLSMRDAETGEALTSCPHPKQRIWAELSGQVSERDILRVRACT